MIEPPVAGDAKRGNVRNAPEPANEDAKFDCAWDGQI
jgi:hypothetical protein